MQLDRYRQIDFTRIQGYPNAIRNELRNVIPKFLGSSAITGEDHIKAFQNIMDNFEDENEDVVMKMLIQSLIDDAREWYKVCQTYQ